MAVRRSETFKSISNLTLVQVQGTVTQSGSIITMASNNANSHDDNGWYDNRGPISVSVGDIVYCRVKVPTKHTLNQAMIFCVSDSSIAQLSTVTPRSINIYVKGEEFDVYSGVIGGTGIPYTANTFYDWKFVFVSGVVISFDLYYKIANVPFVDSGWTLFSSSLYPDHFTTNNLTFCAGCINQGNNPTYVIDWWYLTDSAGLNFADAGLDQEILITERVQLQGNAVQSGEGDAYTYAWSKVSGPGNVSFADATVPTTSATFTLSGIYVLKLIASDGAIQSEDTVRVTVYDELLGYSFFKRMYTG